MLKSFLKFAAIVIVAHVVTYYVAGVIAQLGLGASDFYPPSPNAISYLRDPRDPTVQAWIVPAQVLRGLLFAIVLFPFVGRILALGTWKGGLAVAGIIWVVGFVAASGGPIEHLVYLNEYPVRFAVISLVEILIQSVALGWLVVWFMGKVSRERASRFVPGNPVPDS
jgi:hypothetical protein